MAASLSLVLLSALLLLLSSSTTTNAQQAGVSCLDANGNAVDYWYAVKTREGMAYVFMTSNDQTWETSAANLLTNPSGPVYTTLQQIYTSVADSWVMFNDETPPLPNSPNGITSFTMGHTKGVGASGSGSGFFLTHSVPKFPPPQASGYTIGNNAWTYGQSFLCVSVSEATLNDIAEGWQYTNPQIYDSNLANPSAMPNMQNAINQVVVSAGGTNNVQFSTLGGVTFNYLTKNAAWGQDIYEGLVAPFYSSSLYVDSWAHGTTVMKSYCPSSSSSSDAGDAGDANSNSNSNYAVQNVNELALNGGDGGVTASWYETDDHSKWCVTVQSQVNAVCVGDINRVTSQFQRGGGMLCTSGVPNAFTTFTQMVQSVWPCATSTSSSSSSSYATTITTGDDNKEQQAAATGGSKVGIALGVGAGIIFAAVGVAAVLAYQRKKRQQLQQGGGGEEFAQLA